MSEFLRAAIRDGKMISASRRAIKAAKRKAEKGHAK